MDTELTIPLSDYQEMIDESNQDTNLILYRNRSILILIINILYSFLYYLVSYENFFLLHLILVLFIYPIYKYNIILINIVLSYLLILCFIEFFSNIFTNHLLTHILLISNNILSIITLITINYFYNKLHTENFI